MCSVKNGVNGANTRTMVYTTENRVSNAALQSSDEFPSPFNLFRLVRTYQLVRLSMNFIKRGKTVYSLYKGKKKNNKSKKTSMYTCVQFLYSKL